MKEQELNSYNTQVLKLLLTLLLVANFTQIIAQNGRNWMSYLPGTTNISSITIPGTHDSGSYGEADLELNWAAIGGPSTYITQSMSFLEQLNNGIRFFDIRLKESDTYLPGDPIIVHGEYVKFHTRFKRDVLGAIKSFFQDYKDETVIMTIQHDQGNKGQLGGELKSIIQHNDYKNLFFTENRLPALKEVRGKIVLIHRAIPDVPGISYKPTDNVTSIASPYTYNPNGPYIKVNNYYDLGTDSCLSWPFTNCDANKDRKWGRVKELMEEAQVNRSTNKLYLNAVNGYTSKTIAGIPTPIPDITDVSDYMNPRVKNYMRKISKSYGVLILDWVDSSLIEAIYKVNFSEWFFDTRAVLYEDANFGGNAIRIKGDISSLSSYSFNDEISSVKIKPNYEYFGYEHSGYSGKYISLRGNVSYVGSAMNDRITSMYWLGIPTAVHFYEDVNFTDDGNRPTSFYAGSYDDSLTNTSVGNDEISSLRIPPNWTVRLYRDGGFSGGWVQFTAGSSSWWNVSDITDTFSSWNDEVSSARIWNYRYSGRTTNANSIADKSGNTITFSKDCASCNDGVGFKISPNPITNGRFSLMLNSEESSLKVLKIYNTLGQLMYHQELELYKGANQISVEVPTPISLSKGVYMVAVESGDGTQELQKIIIK